MSRDGAIQGKAGRSALAGRLRLIRQDRFGEQGIPDLAREVGLPERTWNNYECGVPVPGEVLLEFLEITSAEPAWLLTGRGPRYRPVPDAPDRPAPAPASS